MNGSIRKHSFIKFWRSYVEKPVDLAERWSWTTGTNKYPLNNPLAPLPKLPVLACRGLLHRQFHHGTGPYSVSFTANSAIMVSGAHDEVHPNATRLAHPDGCGAGAQGL
jgi:hypothetical protein